MHQVHRDPPFCVEVPRRQENVRERAKLFEAGVVHERKKTTAKPHLVKEREDRLVESRWRGAMRENESMMETLQEILKGGDGGTSRFTDQERCPDLETPRMKAKARRKNCLKK